MVAEKEVNNFVVSSPYCPVCGRTTVLRTNSRTGKYFTGCSGFSSQLYRNCKWSADAIQIGAKSMKAGTIPIGTWVKHTLGSGQIAVNGGSRVLLVFSDKNRGWLPTSSDFTLYRNKFFNESLFKKEDKRCWWINENEELDLIDPPSETEVLPPKEKKMKPPFPPKKTVSKKQVEVIVLDDGTDITFLYGGYNLTGTIVQYEHGGQVVAVEANSFCGEPARIFSILPGRKKFIRGRKLLKLPAEHLVTKISKTSEKKEEISMRTRTRKASASAVSASETVKSSSSSRPSAMEIAKDDLEESFYRYSGKKLSKKANQVVTKIVASFLPEKHGPAAEELMKTPLGLMITKVVMGWGLTYAPGPFQDKRAQRIIREFRVQGNQDGFEHVTEVLEENLAPLMTELLSLAKDKFEEVVPGTRTAKPTRVVSSKSTKKIDEEESEEGGLEDLVSPSTRARAASIR